MCIICLPWERPQRPQKPEYSVEDAWEFEVQKPGIKLRFLKIKVGCCCDFAGELLHSTPVTARSWRNSAISGPGMLFSLDIGLSTPFSWDCRFLPYHQLLGCDLSSSRPFPGTSGPRMRSYGWTTAIYYEGCCIGALAFWAAAAAG